MPTYSKDTLTTALAAYRNGEYTSIRKCAYAFNLPRSTCNGGGMPKVFIGLNQGLTKAGEEGVGTMNTVRCNHCSRYMS
jgi:hypothetical protein